MFETVSHSEIPLPKELAPNGERLWSYVHVQLHTPWFYAEAEHLEEGCNSHSMYILSSVAQVQHLADNPAIKLTAVHVSTPKYINNSDCWKMYRVKRILRGRKKGHLVELWTTVFEVYGEGNMIYYPPLHAKEKLKDIEILLEF